MTNTISNIIDLTNAPTPPRWFEFLLEPGRLQHHLETSCCDPSPTQLIALFFRNIPTSPDVITDHSPSQKTASTNGNNASSPPVSGVSEEVKPNNECPDYNKKLLIDHNLLDTAEIHIPPDSYEAKYRTKKAYALQILAIKVASFLKWDLDVICNNLTIPVQYKLLQAFVSACSSKDCPDEVKKFADIIYWHWFLRSAITYQLSNLQLQSNNTTIIYLSQLQQQQQAADTSALSSMGELFAPSSKQLKSCSSDLHAYIWELTHNKDNSAKKMKGASHPFKKVKLTRPTMGCFDSRDEQFNDWGKCESIDSKEFIEAACYDLGRFFFFEESYELAKHSFEIIKDSSNRFTKLLEYLKSATDILDTNPSNGLDTKDGVANDVSARDIGSMIYKQRMMTEKYLFDCMTQFSKSQMKEAVMEVDSETKEDEEFEKDSDLRFDQQNQHQLSENNSWYQQLPPLGHQQQLLEAAKGDVFMSQGNFKQAMSCFVGTLMLMTDYFRCFSKNYVEEEQYISRMIQCSISLSCFTQAVALCQMTRNLNYTIAFKQLNERVCNDCCDDIYECIWNVTLLEYIINLHSKRGEVERRTRVIQLIGQLELNENNPEDILKEAEHVRRGRFFRIMSNKYL